MKGTLIAVGFLLTAVVAALAHSGATGVVMERMDQMKRIAGATKTIGRMLKGEIDYDADVVAARARIIADAGGEELTRLFPEGSTMAPSEVRPEIWTEWSRFVELSDDMKKAALRLADGARYARDGSETAPTTRFRELARTCKACHRRFRISK